MWSLSLHGLSEVRLEDVRVERNSDLSEVRARVLVHVNKLLLNGIMTNDFYLLMHLLLKYVFMHISLFQKTKSSLKFYTCFIRMLQYGSNLSSYVFFKHKFRRNKRFLHNLGGCNSWAGS